MTIPEEKLQEAHQFVNAVRNELRKVLIGQDAAVDETLIALLAGGHVLVEGVPGLGKTLLIKALAKTFDGRFARIQFTPDLMPADVVGHTIVDAATHEFKIREGPVFANLVLADEINRAPAKTQSALLEAMQEGQVTLEGAALPLPTPFMVLATQNPIEHEGTYPLPEAQLDRFLFKILIGYPSADEERRLTRSATLGQSGQWLDVSAVATLAKSAQLASLVRFTAHVEVDERVLDYAVAIARATRETPTFAAGAGPRGSIALVRAGRARALLSARSFVTPDDIKTVALPALRHRVVASAETEIEGLSVDMLLNTILDQVAAPRS